MKQRSEHAQVASLAKKFCKGLGIKATAKSESFSGGTSVRVTVTDQSPEIYKQIQDELSKYEYGKFDGLTDCYYYSNVDNNIPQVKYLFVENQKSEEMYAKLWSFLKNELYMGDNVPEEYDPNWYCQEMGEYGSNIMHRVFSGAMNQLSKQFWN